MQLLLADLHELWPLQLLPPAHFTLAGAVESPAGLCAKAGVVRNTAPTAAAKTAPVSVLRSIVVIFLRALAVSRHFSPRLNIRTPGLRFGISSRTAMSFDKRQSNPISRG